MCMKKFIYIILLGAHVSIFLVRFVRLVVVSNQFFFRAGIFLYIISLSTSMKLSICCAKLYFSMLASTRNPSAVL